MGGLGSWPLEDRGFLKGGEVRSEHRKMNPDVGWRKDGKERASLQITLKHVANSENSCG